MLGSNLRKYRQLRGLSMEKLANMIDVNLSQISRWELGLVSPRVSSIFDIAEVLDVEVSKFFEED
ncbi:helix-turn-helix transcriptional regulator [Pedobacter sp. PAMC26386]|nr:helix-turn-helix transcriptional regulator [Pedobacter sp. PAMC26386]